MTFTTEINTKVHKSNHTVWLHLNW